MDMNNERLHDPGYGQGTTEAISVNLKEKLYLYLSGKLKANLLMNTNSVNIYNRLSSWLTSFED